MNENAKFHDDVVECLQNKRKSDEPLILKTAESVAKLASDGCGRRDSGFRGSRRRKIAYNGAKTTQKLADVLLGNFFYTDGYDDSPFRTAAYNDSKPPIEVMRGVRSSLRENAFQPAAIFWKSPGTVPIFARGPQGADTLEAGIPKAEV